MELIRKVSKKRNGCIEIEFSNIETFRILREELNFKHSIIGNKRNFIRMEKAGPRIVQFEELKIAFREYLRSNYDSLDIPESITLEKLIDATYVKTPIFLSNNNLRRELEERFPISADL